MYLSRQERTSKAMRPAFLSHTENMVLIRKIELSEEKEKGSREISKYCSHVVYSQGRQSSRKMELLLKY